MRYFCICALISMTAVSSAFAQKWEVGGGIGGAFFTSNTVSNGGSSGSAGLDDAVAASFWLSNNSGRLFGGEFRYDYENTSLKLTSSGANANFGADTHAVHYDFVFHFAPKESRIRPYIAAGGGIKVYRGTGKETAYQPLANLALLTKTDDIKGLISVGGGLKFAITRALLLRLEVRDAITPFPTKVITPAQGSKLNGWLQDFVAMVGVSATF